MKKNEIIEYLRRLPKGRINSDILSLIGKSLTDYGIYKIESSGDKFKIHTDIEEGNYGSYLEILCAYDGLTKTSSLIVTTKEYCPSYQRRYVMEEVGLEIFTQSSSYVYDQTGRVLHKSWFSDENKYYGSDRMPLDYSPVALASYFKDTTPKYKNGYFESGPNSSYQPFTNVWQRYGDTNVVREFGRSPINGEYSNILITFDDHSYEDVNVLSESYGQFYLYGRRMKLSSEGEIIPAIERIYQASKTNTGFDFDKFNSEFEVTMFEPSGRKY